MKLRTITEADIKPRTIIRDTAGILGDFIQFVYDHGEPDKKQALDTFLKEPNPQNWNRSRWLIDAIIKTHGTNRQLTDRITKWAQLRQLTGPTVVAALYDIDPQQANDTPLQGLIMGKSTRNKYKKAMGPQGYIGTMANVGEIGHTRLKQMLRSTAKNSDVVDAAMKHDLPNIRPAARF